MRPAVHASSTSSFMRSSIEVLESRIAPAGLVAVTYDAPTGVLTITATTDPLDPSANHSVHVFPTGANTFRIEANDDTDIGGFGAYLDETGKLTAVTYTGGEGGDLFQINNFKS